MATIGETMRGGVGGAWSGLPVASLPLARADLRTGDAQVPLFYGAAPGSGSDVSAEVSAYSLSRGTPERALATLVGHNAEAVREGALPHGMKLVLREDSKIVVAKGERAGLPEPVQSFPTRTRVVAENGRFVDVAIDMESRDAHVQTGREVNGMTEGVSLRVTAQRIVTDGILFFFDARNEAFLPFLNKLGKGQGKGLGIRFESALLPDWMLIKAAELIYAAQFGSDAPAELKFFGKPVEIGSNRPGTHPDLFSIVQVKLAAPAQTDGGDVRPEEAALEFTKRAFGLDWQYQVLIRRPEGSASPRMGPSEKLLAAGLLQAIGRASA